MTNLQINILNKRFAPLTRTSIPNFRGANIPVQQQDALEINSKENKKKNDNNFVAKLLLGALGVGTAIFASVKLYKTLAIKPKEELSLELKKIQQIYKDIFKREISAEETKDFVQRYKKIINSKTPDNDREYCEKLLDEICKDRQTKRPKILRWIANSTNADSNCTRKGMATAPDGTYIDVYAYNYHNNAKSFFESLFHETHHVKQDEIIYRTDKEFFLNDLLDKFVLNGEGSMYKELLRKNKGNVEKTLNEAKHLLSEQIDHYWGCFEPFARNSAEFKEGERLIEGKKNYKPFWECVDGEYKKQIIEKGAYEDGEKAEILFDLLKQISL